MNRHPCPSLHALLDSPISLRCTQEPAVRQTKRRRTRDASCQTLTYRELRDNENTTLSIQPKPVGGKIRNHKPNPPSGATHLVQPRQRQRHQQHHPHHHVMPMSRYGSMSNPPTSPLSSATTVSTASVYRVTEGGGIVHGAVVRGGGEGARKRPSGQRQARMAVGRGSGQDLGGILDAGVFPFREVHAGGASTATTMAARQQGGQSDGTLIDSFCNPGEGEEMLASSVDDGQGTLLCSPPPSQQRSPSQHQTRDRAKQELRTPTLSRHPRPDATSSQRASPRLGQVSVSWGQELSVEEEATEEEKIEPFTTVGVPVASPSFARGGKAPRTIQADRDVWSPDYQDMLEDYEKPGSRRSSGGGFAYEPLSEGPDYRKVDSSVQGCVIFFGKDEWSRQAQ